MLTRQIVPGRAGRCVIRGWANGSVAAVSVLAIDLGTGSVKVALVADDLTVLRQASRGYPVRSPEPGAALGDPADWAVAVEDAVAEVLAGAGRHRSADPLRGTGLSGQMHGLVLLDVLGATVGPALLWPDIRAGLELRRLAAGPDTVLARLANPLVPGMAGPMLARLARTEPERVARSSVAVQPKDWLRTAIAGVRAVAADPSDASATLLWDVPGDCWDADAAALLGLDPGLLAAVRPSREVVAETTGALGLPPGVPVVTGAGDTACAALGTGTLIPGRGQVSIGTGGQILAPIDATTARTATRRPVVHTYRDAADGWYRMGAVQNCGLALERVLEWLGATWPEALAALVGSVTRAPVFLPHLSGERTPWLDPSLRGAWVGLGLEHERADLLRGALLGVACAIADAWDAVVASGAEPGVPLLVGGGSVDGAWRRLLADLLGTPLLPAQAPDAAVLGAGALALVASGRMGLGEAAAVLDQRAAAGAVPVEPAPTAAAWVGDVRARFADARERLSGG